jgi:cob(I)alamin adenosyltransferase
MKIYTKTGDKGQTSLVGGTRVSKADPRLDAYGTVDELNAAIGLLIAGIDDDATANFLQEIQSRLFDLGAILATDQTKTGAKTSDNVFDSCVQNIEKEIDDMTAELPQLNRFVLPGGNEAAARCHLCRTIARRAERRMWESHALYPIADDCFIFVNRLSDFFFVLARKFVNRSGSQEIFWESHCRY